MNFSTILDSNLGKISKWDKWLLNYLWSIQDNLATIVNNSHSLFVIKKWNKEFNNKYRIRNSDDRPSGNLIVLLKDPKERGDIDKYFRKYSRISNDSSKKKHQSFFQNSFFLK